MLTDMLKMILKAKLPIIVVATKDYLNLSTLLNYYAGEVVLKIEHSQMRFMYANDADYLYCLDTPENWQPYQGWEDIYENLVRAGKTLILVNPEDIPNVAYDAGEMVLPEQVLREFLIGIVEEDRIKQLVGVLSGPDLKSIAETCRLAMSNSGELTVKSIRDVTKGIRVLPTGLVQVSLSYPYYYPDKDIAKWVTTEGQILLKEDVPDELVPRGLLFYGKAGTGKTIASKFLARMLNLPLYRVDLGALLDKYQGVPENRLKAALSWMDNNSPALLLFDEVEKLFATGGDSDTSLRMLSILLWWLQEHDSRVLSILTSNNMEKIPNELIRPGRIDEHYEVQGILGLEVDEFICGVVSTLKGRVGTDLGTAAQDVFDGINNTVVYSQSDLVKMVHAKVKHLILKNQ